MLYKTYFFVPANKKRFFKKSEILKGINNRIIDFEDSVSEEDIDDAISNFIEEKSFSTDWIRIPISEEKFEKFRPLLVKKANKVVLPKIKGYKHFKKTINELFSINPEIKIILLVENAKLYLELNKILRKWSKLIIGLGFGSHDFCSATQISHENSVLFPLRLELSLIAKAYDIEPIDIASMNISDQKEYESEVFEGFNLGYRSKFILHPQQLDFLNDFAFYTKEEVTDAEQVLSKFNSLDNKIDEAIITFEGKIFEKPHLKSLKEIVNWGKTYYGANR